MHRHMACSAGSNGVAQQRADQRQLLQLHGSAGRACAGIPRSTHSRLRSASAALLHGPPPLCSAPQSRERRMHSNQGSAGSAPNKRAAKRPHQQRAAQAVLLCSVRWRQPLQEHSVAICWVRAANIGFRAQLWDGGLRGSERAARCGRLEWSGFDSPRQGLAACKHGAFTCAALRLLHPRSRQLPASV